MYKPQFVDEEIYHIYNRGVEKRKIFSDDKDYFRFIHNLFEFNNEDSIFNTNYYLTCNNKNYKIDFQNLKERKPRKLLVEILVFTLMPNHFHLILKQKKEGGIIKFMKKLGIGYANYFNKKYKRVGGLFQGRFKALLIEKEAHFSYLPFYIHTNPLSLFNHKDSILIDEKINFLKEYRWSSFLDYIGEKNFPSITSREMFLNFFGNEKKYLEQTKQWIEEKKEKLKQIKEIILE
ncbi:MAG: transposase [Candidatus Kuenenbacteria bacterium]